MNRNTIDGEIQKILEYLDGLSVIQRIWQKDHTVWKPYPDEISNRLGWLNVPDIMCDQAVSLESFAWQILNDGILHVVLLGMGGSSLGAAVLRETFGKIEPYPELTVLDSTVPDAIRAVSNSIDPHRTLFIVSSKSGTTIEPLMLYRYFRSVVETATGTDRAGKQFIAITDENTPLCDLALSHNFLKVFINPSDIGGRYSVLSYFGLVPAALSGIDVGKLLDRAIAMKNCCLPHIAIDENPGAVLGAFMAYHASKQRDKMTLIPSPEMASFSLWAEQLIAESTGKESKGILPVVDEPLYMPSMYGKDRQFINIRYEKSENSTIDERIDSLKSACKPVFTINLKDKYDIGAEFFRWELAASVAGALLGINPFDQPDVQKSKIETELLLRNYGESHVLPEIECSGSLHSLLHNAESGNYLAIMSYLRQTRDTDEQMSALRKKITGRYGIATTMGYGPRFLHSTGQFHKGGPYSGLFLQFVTDIQDDIDIPGTPYTFGVVAEAQSLGDAKALKAAGRKIARIRIKHDRISSISDIEV